MPRMDTEMPCCSAILSSLEEDSYGSLYPVFMTLHVNNVDVSTSQRLRIDPHFIVDIRLNHFSRSFRSDTLCKMGFY